MKVTMYELLGMVKDGKAPKKIMYNNVVWEYVNHEQDYRSRHNAELFFNDEINNTWVMTHLNTQIEILEEPKGIPENLKDILRVDDLIPPVDENMSKIWVQTIKNQNKINEILDYLESKGDE